MKKSISILVMLIVMALSANAITINVECTQTYRILLTEDSVCTMVMNDGQFKFYFSIKCGQGNTDIVTGQTYTLSDMDEKASFGMNNEGSFAFISASFVRNADGTYNATVVDTLHQNYNISYAPITEIKDTVDITLDMTSAEVESNVVSDSSILMIALGGYDLANSFTFTLSVFSDTLCGTHTNDEIEYTLGSFYFINLSLGRISFVKDFTITGDTTAFSTVIEFVGTDSVLYRIPFAYDKTPTNVENISECPFSVCSEDNKSIMVYGAEGQEMTLYDMSGRTIMSKTIVSDAEKIDVPVPGVYVVRIGDKSVKTIIN